MKDLKELVGSISHEDLSSAVVDFSISCESGKLPDGVAKDLVSSVCEEYCIPFSHSASMVQSGVMARAAKILREMHSFPAEEGPQSVA